MRRREFIALLGSSVAGWSLASHAQQPAMPVVGFLRSTPATGFAYIVDPFRQGLNDAGFVEGKNVAIEYRWADNQEDRLPGLAADLMRRQVAAIVGPAFRRRRQPKPQPRRRRSYSSSEPTRSALVWSQASTGRAAISRVSSFPLPRCWPSCSGCCTSWFPRRQLSPCCATQTVLMSRASRETWRKRPVPSDGKS